MIPLRIDPGTRFAHLSVVRPAAREPGDPRLFVCRCDCGAQKTIRLGDLRSGKTRACGDCHFTTEMTVAAKGTHGEGGAAYSPEYGSWRAMRQRCNDPKFEHYANYGGRGITVCDRWALFPLFLADMGRKPTPSHTIDRIDPDGNYEPANCRWATRTEQNQNTRKTRARKAPEGEAVGTQIDWNAKEIG